MKVLFAFILGSVGAFKIFGSRSLQKSSSTLSATSEAISAIINSSISEHSVMIFSKSYCPFCTKAKNVFESLNIKYGSMELDKISDGAEIQSELLSMTGQRTVPSVWINTKHIGGCDDTLKLYSEGKIQEMVK